MQMVPSFLLFVSAIFILPESPRFLVTKGRDDQARKVLAYVRHLSAGHAYINGEMEDIKGAIENQARPMARSGKGRLGLFKELWWVGNRKRMLIGLGLMFGQNLTGINGVNFYTPVIFTSIGFDGTKVVLLASGQFPPLMWRGAWILMVYRHVRSRQNNRNTPLPSLLHRPCRPPQTASYFLHRHIVSALVHRRLRHSCQHRPRETAAENHRGVGCDCVCLCLCRSYPFICVLCFMFEIGRTLMKKGFLLLRLERRRVGVLRGDLPSAHQRARCVLVHRCAMAVAVCYRARFAFYAC
jgi:hypothetical protein